jgi:poly(3-hydroxyalkanoate) synthetase
VLARDIPVFREVAKDSAYYFAVADGPGLAADIQAWLALYRAGTHPDSHTMPWLTWAESARTTQELIIDMSTESRAT